ncbi:aromatic ring-hydroxylating dioxygenase subunit alpha [Emcibacter sp. SYSU 3D8]|uniref:aromatic ring-hydroxylating oxygenase subunit alpha n=1 Tax=Emcibacter sp. SYSU 3D8 TaxID=3133969 RepID=UPI0031FEDC1B
MGKDEIAGINTGTLPINDRLRGDPITGDRYYSPEFAKQEWDHMWTRVWHVAGRLSDIPETGDYVVHNFKRESVVVFRQADGSVRGFYNSCKHRGNRLAWSTLGGGELVCSYHGWRWGIDGTLEQVQDPDDFEGGDPCGKLHLSEVAVDTWGGFIWYNMDPNPRPLLDFLDPIPFLFRNRDLENMVRVVWRTFDVDANWKFSSDNFNESYHLPTVHPELATTTDEDYKNTIFEMYPNGHNRMIEQGQPSMRAPHPNEVEQPWDAMLAQWGLDPKNFAGRARDGRLALQEQRRKLGPQKGYHHYAEWSDDELTDYFHHTLFPNVTMTGTADGVHFFRTEPHPTDPEKCTFDYWALVPMIEGETEVATIVGTRPLREADYEFVPYGSGTPIPDMLDSFLIQDLGVAVGQQNGFHSRGYTDAFLSGQETRVRRFHEVLNDYIEGRR